MSIKYVSISNRLSIISFIIDNKNSIHYLEAKKQKAKSSRQQFSKQKKILYEYCIQINNLHVIEKVEVPFFRHA